MNRQIFSPEILIFCGSVSWGGMEIMALETAKQLQKQGFKVGIVCTNDSSLYVNSIQSGLNIFCKFKNSNKFTNIRKFAGSIKTHNIKIIHTHFSNDLWTIVPALKMSKSGSKLFLTKHLASGVVKKDILHKNLYNRVEKIFAISVFIKQNVIETCPVPESKVVLLPNGTDLNVFTRTKYSRMEIRNEFNIADSKIVIGLIGRITPGKGHKEFIEAIEIVNKTNSADTVYLVTGNSAKSEEHFEAEIKQMANDKNINNIIFTGYRNDIAQVLAGTDILAFPSHEESFGITLLEAMAMEVPVIASNNAGVTDIIPNEGFGLLIPPKNSSKLAWAMLKLINDSGHRKKLVLNGRKRVIKNFDIENITRDLVKHYAIS